MVIQWQSEHAGRLTDAHIAEELEVARKRLNDHLDLINRGVSVWGQTVRRMKHLEDTMTDLTGKVEGLSRPRSWFGK